jgi:formate-dependent nitrite reductase membrane component NrfD
MLFEEDEVLKVDMWRISLGSWNFSDPRFHYMDFLKSWMVMGFLFLEGSALIGIDFSFVISFFLVVPHPNNYH